MTKQMKKKTAGVLTNVYEVTGNTVGAVVRSLGNASRGPWPLSRGNRHVKGTHLGGELGPT